MTQGTVDMGRGDAGEVRHRGGVTQGRGDTGEGNTEGYIEHFKECAHSIKYLSTIFRRFSRLIRFRIHSCMH